MSEAAITHRTGDYYGDNSDNLIWEITDTTGTAAELYVSTETHEIMNITVRNDRRREGLACVLYETANATVGIYHAPVAHRTEEGAAFAEAVGGDTAEYSCDCAGCDTTEEEC